MTSPWWLLNYLNAQHTLTARPWTKQEAPFRSATTDQLRHGDHQWTIRFAFWWKQTLNFHVLNAWKQSSSNAHWLVVTSNWRIQRIGHVTITDQVTNMPTPRQYKGLLPYCLFHLLVGIFASLQISMFFFSVVRSEVPKESLHLSTSNSKSRCLIKKS